jgi:Helix-turn-helix domain
MAHANAAFGLRPNDANNVIIAHDPDSALTENHAADFLGLSVSTLRAWRVRGGGPRYVKFSKAVRYQRRALIEFQRAHTITSTPEADTHEDGAQANQPNTDLK